MNIGLCGFERAAVDIRNPHADAAWPTLPIIWLFLQAAYIGGV
jgi:hypothetical protein